MASSVLSDAGNMLVSVLSATGCVSELNASAATRRGFAPKISCESLKPPHEPPASDTSSAL